MIKCCIFVFLPEISMANSVAERKETAKAVTCRHLAGKRIYLKKGMVFHNKEEIPNINSMLQTADARKNLLTTVVGP